MFKHFYKTALSLALLACSTLAISQKVALEETEISDNYLGWWARCISDINGDGIQDVAIAKQSRVYGNVTPGWLGWYEAKDGGKRWEKKVIENNSLLGSGDLAAGDIDNDGDNDIVAFEGDETSKDTTARMYWYENPGKGSTVGWTKHYIDTNPEFVKDVELADLDRDGRLDIVTVTYWHHSVAIHYQKKKGEFSRGPYLVVKNVHEGLHVGDIDGDKYIDIAANGYWIKNPGKKKKKQWEVFNIAEKWHNQVYAGPLEWRHNGTKVFCRDITGDGKAEVFISHSEANVDGYDITWYQRDPKTNTWTEHSIAKDYHHCHTLQVFDMDNDGDFDVVAGEIAEHPTQKRVRIFLNKGNNLDWEEQVIDSKGFYNGIVADLEGDGDFDIFGSPGYGDDFKSYKLYKNLTKK
jgi:hypothetical protein